MENFDKNYVDYHTVHKILYEKFKATHDEIRYWIKRGFKFYHNNEHYLRPTISEFELKSTVNNLHCVGDSHYSFCDFFYPEYYFYEYDKVIQFDPIPHLRFVYIRDLTSKRNWNGHKLDRPHSKCYEVLSKACEAGILRLYDNKIDEFTNYRTFENNGIETKEIWGYKTGADEYINNPDSFFLLQDIINVERIFFKKDKNLCMKELMIGEKHVK